MQSFAGTAVHIRRSKDGLAIHIPAATLKYMEAPLPEGKRWLNARVRGSTLELWLSTEPDEEASFSVKMARSRVFHVSRVYAEAYGLREGSYTAKVVDDGERVRLVARLG